MQGKKQYKSLLPGGKLTARFDAGTLLDAVALQDHYARQMKVGALPKVGSLFKKPNRNITLPPIRHEEIGVSETHARNNFRNRANSKNKSRAVPKKTTLANLDYRHYLDDKVEKEEKKFEEVKEKEYQNFVSKLTLAQKRGLIKKPDAPLTIEEWQKVFNKAKERVRQENACPICMDDFKLKPQVVLSCSHFFHRDCLENFEKFNNCRKCPICRAS